MDYNKVSEWKKKYGDVYVQSLKGTKETEIRVIFRALTIREMEIVQNIESEARREEDVCRMAILNGVEVDDIAMGHMRHLSSRVIEISTIPDEETLLQKAMENRNKLENNLHKGLVLKICRVFPLYTPDILSEKNIEQLLELIAMAEMVSGEKIISTDPKGTPDTQVPLSPKGKWSMNEAQAQGVSMEASTDDLSTRMAKETGKTVPKFKPKTVSKTGNALHDQMQEMNQMLGTQ